MSVLHKVLLVTILACFSGPLIADEVFFAPLTCEYYPSKCKTEKERRESQAKLDQREAAEKSRHLEEQNAKRERDRLVAIETARLGQHRAVEAANLVAMREAAERARPRVEPPPPAPEPKCRDEMVVKRDNSHWMDTREQAYARMERLSVNALCPPGGGSKDITCTSDSRPAPGRQDKCLTSVKLCPRETVWQCTAVINCATPKKVCESSGPAGVTRQ